MFIVKKNLFIFRLNDEKYFFPQIPTIIIKKKIINIFFSYRKKKEVKLEKKTKARVGLIKLNENYKLLEKFKKIDVRKNSLYYKYSPNGLMPAHIYNYQIFI